MLLSDLKLYVLNIFSFAVSFSDIDVAMKFILLSLSIWYTIERIIKLRKENKDEPEGKD
jgi:hypothetical protein